MDISKLIKLSKMGGFFGGIPNFFDNFKEMEEIVLSYPKLKDRLGNKEDDTEKALKCLKEIRSELSLPFLKGFEKFLDASLGQIYDGINFNDNGYNLKKLSKENNIVLVPNHQSHADYLAINYVYFKKYKSPLFVAGGNNLNIFPIGPMFRRCGCFFIRRTFANDIIYKLTLEAYLYYMLVKGNPIEFFFEGGRSRTGKLLPPRYGLYQMLIEAHQAIPEDKRRDLKFIPVSIVHEYVPEQKSLARELDGGKKKKESAGQVFGLVKLLSYQFGNVHINIGHPVTMPPVDHANLKAQTQKIAFECFFEVGKNMRVTPTSLLAIILLDEPSGALKWEEILTKARHIITYCQKFNVPITDSLKLENMEKSLERSIDILIGNKKVEAIGNPNGNHVFYSIKDDSRKEILYFKNTVLHHFLVPWIVNMGWVNLFSGHISNVDDLKKFFIVQRKQLMHEFYLPTVKVFLSETLAIVSDAVGREITTLEECMELSHKELYLILAKVSLFSRACNYLLEAYYVCGLTLTALSKEYKEGFKMETFLKRYKEAFDSERKLKRIIKYAESYSVPLSKSSLQYFIHTGVVASNNGYYTVADSVKLAETLAKVESDLTSQLSINLLN
ncbi:1-acyl-sn-glycerol-3-phosphate acyltransferase [Bacteriovorax sp. PP10]|uniref:Glycerol-3-phosphate acyltransferase n=1 Tax=Bacteriovorax antarcticus TaxID=3088717 RepID=A0ABU5VVK6_9BACT|nr:1-acyl-sn-glycerol-3-phosphate acyltransferase [Bacteriovorax sp. PP10]MEA9356423.1 1-acyl-sn-glycerol-3-phosphate acyltransferase [Bacteriovorax sp. PP10]